jgi:hypothetical protein
VISNSIPRYMTKRICSHKNLYMDVHIPIIHHGQRVATKQWVDKWDVVNISTTEFYLATKGNDVWIHTTKKMSSKRNQTHSLWFYSYEILRISKFIETESRLTIAKGCRRGEWRTTAKVSLGSDQNVELDGGDACTTFKNILKTTEL